MNNFLKSERASQWLRSAKSLEFLKMGVFSVQIYNNNKQVFAVFLNFFNEKASGHMIGFKL